MGCIQRHPLCFLSPPFQYTEKTQTRSERGFSDRILRRNKLLEEDLNQKRNELLSFIQHQLNNFSIQLQIIVPEYPKGSSRPYTDREKFNRMAEKNPSLLDLREQLDLDVE